MRFPRFRFARLSSIVAACTIALSAVVGPAMVPEWAGGRVAQALEVDIDLFRRELSPYGEWFHHDRYGEVWRPTHVRRDWRPYYDDGHWAYSDDYGWMWVSDQPWGWAPFHYGRWAYARDNGWLWVPGRQWGPAWVTFRSGQDSIGWAPLPPEARWDPGYGFLDDDDDYYDDYYDDNDFSLAGVIWSFVRPQGFLEPNFRRYAYDRRDYPRIIHRTRNVTNITVINKRVVNRSIEINNIERVTRKKVRRVRVEEADRPERTRRKGDRIVVYKPVVVEKEGRRWNSRGGDGLRADELPTKRKKKRGADEVDTARERQVEPSAGTDLSTEQPLRKKKKRSDTARQQVEPSTGADLSTEQPVRKKKKRSNATAGDDNQVQQFGQGEDEQPVRKKKKKRSNAAADTQMQQFGQGEDEQPVRKKKKKRSNAAADTQVQQFGQGEDEQPVRKKKKKRSNAAADTQVQQFGQGEDEQPVRKKKKKRSNAAASDGGNQLDRIEPSAGGDDSVRKKRKRDRSEQQIQNQQQEEQPRRKNKKRCKGDGCPDNN
jgi:hypothetical protein